MGRSLGRHREELPGQAGVVLTGVRAEFRTALLQEIGAARQELTGRATTLQNGRRIARVGAAYQYAFTLENALFVPDDTPGELRVPGRPAADVVGSQSRVCGFWFPSQRTWGHLYR